MKNPIKSLVARIGVPATIGLLLITGIGLGALVNIISNSLQATITTKIPLETKFTDVSDRLSIQNNETIIGTVYGGDTIWYRTETINHANNPIARYPVTILSSDKGLSAGLYEIEKVIYKDANGEWDITNMLYCVNPNGTLTQLRSCPAKGFDEPIEIFFDNNGDGNAQPYTIKAGETLWNNITIKLSPALAEQTIHLKYEEHFSLP
jgi:hypothetical protein